MRLTSPVDCRHRSEVDAHRECKDRACTPPSSVAAYRDTPVRSRGHFEGNRAAFIRRRLLNDAGASAHLNFVKGRSVHNLRGPGANGQVRTRGVRAHWCWRLHPLEGQGCRGPDPMPGPRLSGWPTESHVAEAPRRNDLGCEQRDGG